MARTRSPNYPTMDLGEAIAAIRPVFEAEHRNKFSRHVLAEHLGYSGLNGRSLTKIGAVRAYGLIEGSGDDLRLSEDAIAALMAPERSQELRDALERCAMKPALFQELHQEFQGLPSDNNLRFWLIKRHYTPEAAGKAASTYLATMRLVSGSDSDYAPPRNEEVAEMEAAPSESKAHATTWGRSPRPGVLQEIFNLEEGPVTLTFPALLSSDSYQDLADHIAIFLRKAKRRSEPGGHDSEPK